MMPRAQRIEQADAWYWVNNQSLQSRTVFADETDLRAFIAILAQLEERFELEVHAYAFCKNQFQLLVRTRQPNLAASMRYLQSLYTQNYNRRWRDSGPLFRGRYRSTLFQHETYLLPLSAAMHLLPKAIWKLGGSGESVLTSSYLYYTKPKMCPEWLHLETVLSLIHGSKYTAYLQSYRVKPELICPSAERYPAVLGDAGFRNRIMANARDAAVVTDSEPSVDLSLEQVVSSVSSVLRVNRKALFEGRRGRLNIPRMMAIYLSYCRARISLEQVADHFGLGHCSSASSAMQRYQRLRAKERRVKRLELDVLKCLEGHNSFSI